MVTIDGLYGLGGGHEALDGIEGGKGARGVADDGKDV